MKYKIVLAIGVLAVLMYIVLSRKSPEKASVCCAIEQLDANVLRDVTYKTVNQISLKLDIYKPYNPLAEKLPVVLYIHGGSWSGGDKNVVDKGFNPFLVNRLIKMGLAVVSIDYRLVDTLNVHFPAPIEDCKDAVKWLRKNAERYHFDTGKIGLIGESAGAHLAMLSAYSNDTEFVGSADLRNYSAKVNYIVDIYGPADLNQLFRTGTSDMLVYLYKTFKPKTYNLRRTKVLELFGLPESASRNTLIQQSEKFSPMHYVERGAIPTLILHGDADDLVPLKQSQQLEEKLSQAKIHHKLVIYKGADHAFKHLENSDLTDLTNQVANFIRDQKY